MIAPSAPWVLVLITCVASTLGNLMIYSDVLWNTVTGSSFSILHSDYFLGVALSLSCGTLTVTAINSLLPKAVQYISAGRPEFSDKQANALLVPLFIIGVVVCQTMNYVALKFASRSIVACPHDLDSISRPRKNVVHGNHEHLPLLQDGVHDHGAVRCEERHNSSHRGTTEPDAHHPHTDGHDAGSYREAHSHAIHDHESQIENVKAANNAELLSIGLQTTLGISIHRVPEGLLMFATSQADRQLGLSLVLALSIHSFSEGFSIAAPLYGALKSRTLVVLLAAVLGSGPQLLGALIGSCIFNGADDMSDHAKFIFGDSMAATAGFMTVVSIQMVGSAFRYASQPVVLYGVIAGILISLGSKAI